MALEDKELVNAVSEELDEKELDEASGGIRRRALVRRAALDGAALDPISGFESEVLNDRIKMA